MKKKLAMLLIAVMMVTMGTTSFAANSPTTDTTDTPDSPADEYGSVSVQDGSVIVNGIVVGEVPELKPVTQSKVDEAQDQAEKLVGSTANVLQIVGIDLKGDKFADNVLGIVGIDLRNESYDTLTMTFNVNGVTAGQKLVLLVQKPDGTWVKVTPDKVENGKVTATFNFEFINIAFVAYNASAQTGEMAVILPAMMAASFAGIVVCGKKVKFDE